MLRKFLFVCLNAGATILYALTFKNHKTHRYKNAFFFIEMGILLNTR